MKPPAKGDWVRITEIKPGCAIGFSVGEVVQIDDSAAWGDDSVDYRSGFCWLGTKLTNVEAKGWKRGWVKWEPAEPPANNPQSSAESEHSRIDDTTPPPGYSSWRHWGQTASCRVDELREQLATQTRLRVEAEQRAGAKNVAKLEADVEYYKRTLANLSEFDCTVPHGYPSWKDYAKVLEAERDAAYVQVDKLASENHTLEDRLTWDCARLINERDAHKARVSNQRHELKQVNRAIRLLKLENEVLSGRCVIEQVERPSDYSDMVRESGKGTGDVMPVVDWPTPGELTPHGREMEKINQRILRRLDEQWQSHSEQVAGTAKSGDIIVMGADGKVSWRSLLPDLVPGLDDQARKRRTVPR